MKEKTVAVVMPAFNEEIAIGKTLADFAKNLPDALYFVIDNNSTDKTSAVAIEHMKALNLSGEVLFEPRQGKALAVRKAFQEIEADVYLLVDADSTYLAEDASKLLDLVIYKSVDMAVGNRHENQTYEKVNDRKFHQLGNTLMRKSVNFLFKSDVKDVLSGYRAMSRRFVKTMPIISDGFQLEVELTVHSLDKRMRLEELPVLYRERPPHSASKLNTLRDGWAVLRTMIRMFSQYNPLKFFGWISVVLSFVAILCGAPAIFDYVRFGQVFHFPLAVLASAIATLSALSLGVGIVLRSTSETARQQFELNLLNSRIRDR